MNIQIYGKNKCFDTKKAERWFKERGIRFQSIDLLRVGMSAGELQSVLRAVGGIDAIHVLRRLPAAAANARDAAVVRYLARDEDKLERLLSDPSLIRTPVVRNGRQATCGYCPEVWSTWE